MNRMIAILFLFFALPALVYSQAEVSSEVDRTNITIGDRITYKIHIEYDKGLEILTPGLGANLGQFEIQDFSIGDEVEKDGRISQSFTYIISTYDTGEWEIPPTGIAYRDSSGQGGILKTQPIKINVESILEPGAPPEIKDVKEPIMLPRSYKWLYILGGAILFIAFLIALIIYWRKKRAKGLGLFEPEKPKIPPYDLAMQRLKSLDYEALDDDLMVKIFYTSLSFILREYFEGRYGFDALELTTFEILQLCPEVGIDENVKEKIRKSLELCDLVKFSKYIPPKEYHEKTWQGVYDIIEETRLVEEITVENVETEDEFSQEDESLETSTTEDVEDESA